MFDGGVEELVQFGERYDLVELAIHLRASHAQHGAIQVNVLPSRQFGMETGANFKKAADAALDGNTPVRRFRDSRENLQERALTSPVAPDNAYDVAVLDVE